MDLSQHAHAVMLLTVSLGKYDTSGAKPLSTTEWGKMAIWLKEKDLEPSVFLKNDLEGTLSSWEDQSITHSRLEQLLGRGVALGLALERWQRAGLWVMTRSDPEYPEKLKRRLKNGSPPVLFGCGNTRHLGGKGIAVVGSRNAVEEDIAFATDLGSAAAQQGFSVISGGARGIDESAMLGALKDEGTVVGVLSNSLLRAATSAKFRRHILSGDLVLISPFNPEAGFNVGNAMARNRFIYCLSDAAVVVSSTHGKGGTWQGAREDIRYSWVPLWVKRTEREDSGNAELVEKGGRWFPETDTVSSACLSKLTVAEDVVAEEQPVKAKEKQRENDSSVEARSDDMDSNKPVLDSCQDQDDIDEFYSFFLSRLHERVGDAPASSGDIAKKFGIVKSQADRWLKKGVAEGKIKKFPRPARYQSTASVRQMKFDEC